MRINALAESVNGLNKAELVYWEGPWRGADDLELATLGWVDWFNHTRIHSSLEYRPPAGVEAAYYRHNHAVEPALTAELTVEQARGDSHLEPSRQLPLHTLPPIDALAARTRGHS